jgi:hypothetical protein
MRFKLESSNNNKYSYNTIGSIKIEQIFCQWDKKKQKIKYKMIY